MAPEAEKFHVRICVFQGRPDYQKYRHTAIYFVSVDDDDRIFLYHVKGAFPAFTFEEKPFYNPAGSATCVKIIHVGITKRHSSHQELQTLMRLVAVDNSDIEFNCHLWVDYACRALTGAGLLDDDEISQGLWAMTEATMEAIDET